MDQIRIDKIMLRIEHSFGEEAPFSGRALSEQDTEMLQRIFGDTGYQSYLQDQVNRQIIRDYLTNAVMLGFVTDDRLAVYLRQANTSDGRAVLSLHMLMSAVEQADTLPLSREREQLQALRPTATSRPHMVVIES